MTADANKHRSTPPALDADRVKAFIDAVVAIAMTLLILPLMDSVSEVASDGHDTAHWIAEHRGQLVSFVISFVIIAMFWLIHRRLFTRVTATDGALLWIVFAWMLSIVWLPVATAISGRMSAEDAVATTVYIGSMIATCLLSCATRVYLARHRELHGIDDRDIRSGVAIDLAMATLFGVALAIALLVPAIGAFALFIMALASPLQAVYARALGVRRPGRA